MISSDMRRQLCALDEEQRELIRQLLLLPHDQLNARLNTCNAEAIQRQLVQRVPFFAEHPELLDRLRDDSARSGKLIEGLVQSGKTPVICGLAVFCVQVLQLPVIVLVRNFNVDKEQLIRKFKGNGQFADLLQEDMICDASHRDTRNRSDLFDTPRLILCLENHTPLRRIVELHQNQSFCLIVDEADHVAYKSRPLVSHTWFQQLRARALHFVAVTATVFDVLYLDEQITNRDIHRISPPVNYRGFGSKAFKIVGLPNTFQFRLTADGNLSQNLEHFYLEILGTAPYPDCVYEAENLPRTFHPVICLQKTGTVVKDQLRVMDALGRHSVLGQSFVVIAFNGEGIFAYCPNGQLPLRIGDVTGERYMGMRRNKRLRTESTMVPVEIEVVSYPQLNIPRMLQYLRDNQSVHRVTHIVIIAGKIADRGLNIVSTDYRWHLTHEILMPSKTAVVSEVIQCGGRLCGVMADHLDSFLYVTLKDKHDLERGQALQDHILTEAQSYPETMRMQEFREQVPVNHDMIPIRRTTRKRRAEPNWNTVADDLGEEKNEEEVTDRCGQVFRVRSVQLTEQGKGIYDRVVTFLNTRRGEWMRKADLLRAITNTAEESELIKGAIWHWTSPRLQTSERVPTEEEPGLLIRQQNDRSWYLRLN